MVYVHTSIEGLNYFTGELIAPGTDLVFEIELYQIHDGPKPPNVFRMIDIDDDKLLTRDEVITHLLTF